MSAALTLAPMSPAVAKVWHKLQATMLKETHGVDTVPPGAMVLPPLPEDRPLCFRHDSSGDTVVLYMGVTGHNDAFTKYWTMPEGWEGFWNQARWRLNRYRPGPDGNSWSTAGGAYVMDDFGDLVQVQR
ncbi:MAG TPA: hypothetical protein VE934_12130 [Polaromonas sp.]|uniref:hypothetical protein n=1 Tax=Polaromonas sp. TaxID=1869339 RepID=UPI002D2AE4C8|nr:hypothetical protein [Polaromonas sp.]HYW57704.1 hypothetical protein [Polaromonas sp.]